MLHHPALSALTRTRRFLLSRSILWCGGPTIPRALDELAAARRGMSRSEILYGPEIEPERRQLQRRSSERRIVSARP